MWRAAPLLAALFVAAGCGGDDSESSPAAEATGASGAEGLAAGASYDITVAEFIGELQPDKQRILDAFVADSSACQGVKVDPGFVLLVTAEAIDADPDSPLAELVEDQC